MDESPIYASPAAPAQPSRWPLSAFVLLASNAIPLVGVLLHDWTVFQILLLYWCENVTVGVLNVLRMLCAQPKHELIWAGKLFLIPFFVVHYGMFTFVHGMFVLGLFGGAAIRFGAVSLASLLAAVRGAGIGVPLGAMLASHGFSFFHNYLAGGEYQRVQLSQLMFQPYGRVMLLHVTVLIGAFLAKASGSPLPALVLLIVLKTTLDLWAHLKERRRMAGNPSERGPVPIL
jgi:hypothetical protein